MKKVKKWLIWSLVLLFIGAGLWWLLAPQSEEAPYDSESVIRRDIFQSVSVTGDLKARQELILNFESGGRIKSVKTFIGQRVAKGDILASIDDEILNQQLVDAKAGLDRAMALAGANNDVVREADEALKGTEDYYDDLKKLESQKIKVAELNYDNAKDYYRDALDYYKQVLEDNGVDSSVTKSAKLTLTTADNNKKATKEAMDTAKRSRDLSLTNADNAIETSKERLKTAQSQFAKKSNDATIVSARVAYEIALKNLSKASLKSPVNGTVTMVNYRSGEILGGSSVGVSAGGFGKIISDDFVIESIVPESDILKIKIGQFADVAFDALSDSEVFTGEVVEIEPGATVIQDVVYYKIKVTINELDGRLKADMSADVDIHVEEKNDLIAIPLRAVFREDKKTFVEVVMEDGSLAKKEVKTGIRGDDGFVEIISGLEEGQEVVTLKRN